MSIIYDALQKTQRNREYLRLQNALTQSKPHRRNTKWMVLGSLILTLGAGVIAIYSFYGKPLASRLKQAVQAQSVSQEAGSSAHPWVSDLKKMTPLRPVEPPVMQAPVLPQPVVAEKQPQPVTQPLSQQETQSSVSTVQSQPVQPASVSSSQPVSSVAASGRLTLNGVLISGPDKIALINNQAFHLGDIVDGMKIVSIDFNSVKLQSGAELIELRVPV